MPCSSQPKPNHVCAVLVTHHPTETMVFRFSEVVAQVTALVVVDNGSSPHEVSVLREARQRCGFTLIENPENLGIAEALNQGARWAKDHAFRWVLFLDQDSRLTSGFVDAMLRTWGDSPRRELIVTIQPRYVDPVTGHKVPLHRSIHQYVTTSLTSGSLFPAWAFDKLGYFASDYFIDYVDIEYALRALAKGYVIVQSRDAILLHNAGDPAPHKLLGIFHFRPINHNAARHYYMMRNRIVTARRYWGSFPRWALADWYYASKEIAKMVLAENSRRQKITAIAHGVMDGIFGRMGKMPTSYL